MINIENISIFKSLKYRNFKLLWIGLFISNVGTWSQMFVEQWYVYSLEGSVLSVGLLITVQLIPNVLFMIVGGTLADRINRKKLLLFTQSGMAIITVIIALLVFINQMNLTVFYLLNFLYGIFVSLDIPARRSLVPNLVSKDMIGNATALYQSTFQISLFLGPIVGSTITGLLGFEYAFIFNALTFSTIIIGIYKMDIPPKSKSVSLQNNFLSDLKESRIILLSNKTILIFILLGCFNAIISKIDYLLPAYVENFETNNPTEIIGMFNSVIGIGLFVSALFYGRYESKFFKNKYLILIYSLILVAICNFLLPLVNYSVLAAILIFMRAFFLQLFSLIVIVQLQSITLDEHLGRVMGVYTSFLALSGLLSLPISYIVEESSINYGFWILFLITILSIGLVWSFGRKLTKINIEGDSSNMNSTQ